MKSPWWLLGEAARDWKMSKSGARWFVDTGRVRAVRTPSGVRLIPASEVERVRREREEARRKATTAPR